MEYTTHENRPPGRSRREVTTYEHVGLMGGCEFQAFDSVGFSELQNALVVSSGSIFDTQNATQR